MKAEPTPCCIEGIERTPEEIAELEAKGLKVCRACGHTDEQPNPHCASCSPWAGPKPMKNLILVMAGLRASEINFEMGHFYDSGYDVKFGDSMNGYKAEACIGQTDRSDQRLHSLAEVAEWLDAQAREHFPLSDYAQRDESEFVSSMTLNEVAAEFVREHGSFELRFDGSVAQNIYRPDSLPWSLHLEGHEIGWAGYTPEEAMAFATAALKPADA